MARADAMDAEFERWMEESEIELDPKMRAARWKSLQALLASSSTDQTECLVRLAFDMERIKPADQEREELVQAFKKGDSTFDGRKGHELQILASMVLARLVKRDDAYGHEAALAILCASAGGTRTEIGSLCLVERAREHLDRTVQRHGADISIAEMLDDAVGTLDFTPAVGKLTQGIDQASLKEAFTAMASAIDAKMKTLHAATVEAAKAADRVLARQEQELGMHWWLTGGRSNRLKAAFEDLESLVRPLVLAKELSDLTQDRLGPASIDALLIRAGVSTSRRTTIPAVVAACEPELIEWLSQQQSSPMTSPLHFAIDRQREMGVGDEWVAPWSKTAEIDVAREFTELDLAMQFYRELRLLELADT